MPRHLARARGAAAIVVVILTTIACSATVHITSGRALFKRENYGPGWPFRADSVIVGCKASTGHLPSLTLAIGGRLVHLNPDGSTSPQLPTSDLVSGSTTPIASVTTMASFARRARLAC